MPRLTNKRKSLCENIGAKVWRDLFIVTLNRKFIAAHPLSLLDFFVICQTA